MNTIIKLRRIKISNIFFEKILYVLTATDFVMILKTTINPESEGKLFNFCMMGKARVHRCTSLKKGIIRTSLIIIQNNK